MQPQMQQQMPQQPQLPQLQYQQQQPPQPSLLQQPLQYPQPMQQPLMQQAQDQSQRFSQGPVLLSMQGKGQPGVISSIFGPPQSSAPAGGGSAAGVQGAQGGIQQQHEQQQERLHVGGGAGYLNLSDGGASKRPQYGSAAEAAPGSRSTDTSKPSTRSNGVFSAWKDAQPNSVQVIAVGDSALFQGRKFIS